MPTPKYPVKLSKNEQQQLRSFISKGNHPARMITRAHVLLLAHEERPRADIARALHCTTETVRRICQRYSNGGLNAALHEKPRSGAPRKTDGHFEAKVIALACSTPPQGQAQWTLRLLADRVVQLGFIKSISHTQVGRILKENELKPWLHKQWCLGKLTDTFLWRMEEILHLYERPYDPKRPLLCFDERPCQLIEDVLTPLPMEAGKPKREDAEYKRNGVCALLIAFEPLMGTRFVQVRPRRTKLDYAQFMQTLAREHYPTAQKLVLIQDNLNTHTPASFYTAFSAREAFALAQRFEMHYTPKHASWLNMVEIELSVLARQCLDRRIGDRETLAREVIPWVAKRNAQGATVDWQFTKTDARSKFERFYPNQ